MAIQLLPIISELRIVTKDAEVVRFGDVMKPSQHDLLARVQKQLDENGRARIVILKARQLGMSTLAEAILFVLALFRDNFQSMVVSHGRDSAANILNMTRNYWETFIFKRFWEPRYNGRTHLAWDNHSDVHIATAKNVGAGRSFTLHALHASEVAFWPEPDTLMRGLNKAIPKSGLNVVILESTANGVGNYFHRTCVEAMKGRSDYEFCFYPWWDDPEYTITELPADVRARYCDLGELDEEEQALVEQIGLTDDRLLWRRWCIDNECNGDVDEFHQEYPSCVLAGTRIATSRGLLPVEEVVPGDVTPYGEVLAVHEQLPTRAVRLTTRSGLALDCTWHHPMMTSSGVLMPASAALGMDLELAEMRFADTRAHVGWHDGLVDHHVYMDDDLAMFAGLFMGDGYFHDGALSIVCDGQDEDVVKTVEELFRDIGLEPRTRVVGSKGGGREVRATAKRLIEPFARLGFTHRPDPDRGWKRQVCIPDIIWRSTRGHIQLFLAGLFEADGFSNRKQWDVRLFTCHERLARDVQILLLGFGIHARVRQETARGWVVSMTGTEAGAFHERIGWVGGRKGGNVPSTKPQSPRGRRLEVISVEELGEHPSYDLSIADRPLYGANGLLTHNTPHEAFISTGRNVFHLPDLLSHFKPEKGTRGELTRVNGRITFQPNPVGPLTVFRYPAVGDRDRHVYLIGADPTHTNAGDYACAQVINRDTLEQVAVYREKVTPIPFARALADLGAFYNEAMIAPEKVGPGAATTGALAAMGYPRLYQTQRIDTMQGQPSDDNIGWATSRTTKEVAIAHLVALVHEPLVMIGSAVHGLVVHDRMTLLEMRDYVHLETGLGYGNSDGSEYDDGVMALAIASAVNAIEPAPPPYEVPDPADLPARIHMPTRGSGPVLVSSHARAQMEPVEEVADDALDDVPRPVWEAWETAQDARDDYY